MHCIPYQVGAWEPTIRLLICAGCDAVGVTALKTLFFASSKKMLPDAVKGCVKIVLVVLVIVAVALLTRGADPELLREVCRGGAAAEVATSQNHAFRLCVVSFLSRAAAQGAASSTSTVAMHTIPSCHLSCRVTAARAQVAVSFIPTWFAGRLTEIFKLGTMYSFKREFGSSKSLGLL